MIKPPIAGDKTVSTARWKIFGNPFPQFTGDVRVLQQ